MFPKTQFSGEYASRHRSTKSEECCEVGRFSHMRVVSTEMQQNRLGQSVVQEELVLSTMEEVSHLYTPAADTHLLYSLPAGAVYFGLFYRYNSLFHHR